MYIAHIDEKIRKDHQDKGKPPYFLKKLDQLIRVI